MLKINKTINLSATSEIDGQVVSYMSASISTDGNTSANINKSIANQDLYNANKSQVRKDMAEFEAEVYKVEDELNKVTEINKNGVFVNGKNALEEISKIKAGK